MRLAIRNFLLFIPLFFLLVACESAPPARPSPTSTVSLPAGPYDGRWQGTGQTDTGVELSIFFTVQNSTVTSIHYRFDGPQGTPCFNMAHMVIAPTDQPRIAGKAFTAPFPPDLDLSAVFEGDSSASGHLSGGLNNYRWPVCNTSFEVDWRAEKQVVQAQQPTQPAARPAQPLETLAQILVFGLSNGAVLALNAIGVTLIYGTVRTLNLAHGDVFALTTVLVTSLVNGFSVGRDWPPSRLIGILAFIFGAAVLAGALLSVGVERLAFKPFRGHSRLAPLIATLGLSFILFQGALVWRTFQSSWIPGEHRSVPGLPEVPTDGIPSFLPEIDLTKALGLPLSVVIRFSDVFVLVMAIAFVALATWFLNRTTTGYAIRAVAQNETLAKIMGVNVDQTIRRAFAAGGALAGAAAFIFALYYARPFGIHGAQSGLLAFAAALLGGIGSPVGALMSALLIGIVSSLSDYYLTAQWTSVLLLSLLIGLLIWRPAGLASSGSGSDSTESLTVRDSVILTSPGQGLRNRTWLYISLVVLAVAPILMQLFGLGGQTILRTASIFILLTLGLNLALGLAGLLDFGFALSYGIGAYAAAILGRWIGFMPGLLAGAAVAALTGVLKGALSERLRGDFLAVATLALGLLGRQVLINLTPITGGAGGLGNIPAPRFLGFALITPIEKYFLVFGFLLLAVWLSQRLIDSRTGRGWIAASEDETASVSVGVNVPRARLVAFVLSSALAGLAGALYGGTFSFVEPDMMAFHITSMALTMVILGGAGNVTGAIVGAVTIILYDKVFVPQVADWVALIWPQNLAIGSAPDIRGASYFNFGIALYLTVLLRARSNQARRTLRSEKDAPEGDDSSGNGV